MPESRFKYLYERLGDHDFQLLVNALLGARFSDYTPLPLRQADGGRDGIRRGAPGTLIYQVKWSVRGQEKEPVAWLESTIKGEEDNLRRLASEGASRYILVTNVPSTGKAEKGTFDSLNKRLDRLAADYGLEQMTCLWRESVDAMVDDAPDSVKWTYADMLAGWELVRYLIAEDTIAKHETSLRALLRKVAAVQWAADERVKFSQVDIDREKVADLFIDVRADRIRQVGSEIHIEESVKGAAAHLLDPLSASRSGAYTLVRGAPGQGKSTLSQFVAQAHRRAFIPEQLRPANLPVVDDPLFPIRLDLSDYARWVSGVDIWDPEERKGKRRRTAQSTIECFVADLMSHASGGSSLDAQWVQDLLDRVPAVVVLDGLDEVGQTEVRARVVAEIDRFVTRSRTYARPPQVIVTTRPSTNELPEPSTQHFDVLVLNPLDTKQRDQYMRNWTKVRGIEGAAGRRLRKNYRAKINEPYLDELAGNPMQLTILLDLLHKHGEATPTQRTALYDSYVELLLAREANKHPDSVRKHQHELREIIPFLGWHLHAHTELDVVNTRMAVEDLKATIRHFLHTYGNEISVVDDLFEAASDRLWTLTSKAQGAYEFEVLSLREYFAAKFLYDLAGEDQKGFDRLTVIRELLRRPYWLNTARFYGGNAGLGGVSELADGVLEELAGPTSRPSVIAAWTLLTDGVFNRRPRRAQEVLDVLLSDRHLITLDIAQATGDIGALPRAVEGGADLTGPAWERITRDLGASPRDPLTPRRVVALRVLLNRRDDFALWWKNGIELALADGGDVTGWLWMASSHINGALEGLVVDLQGLDLAAPTVAERTLNTGLVPSRDSDFEAALVQAVLDGRCIKVRSARSFPAQLAVAFSAVTMFNDSSSSFGGDSHGPSSELRRTAISGLRRRRPELAEAARQRRFKAGEKGSTFPWANTATSLHDAVGWCWLVSQTAIIGAASPMRLGLTRQPGRSPFGPDGHPAALIELARGNADSARWWGEQLTTLHQLSDDIRDLALAEWCLAMWCVASASVVTELFETWELLYLRLPEHRRRTLAELGEHMGRLGWLDELPTTVTSKSPVVSELIEWRRDVPPEPPTAVNRIGDRGTAPISQRPLLEIAREQQWFRVDRAGQYR